MFYPVDKEAELSEGFVTTYDSTGGTSPSFISPVFGVNGERSPGTHYFSVV